MAKSELIKLREKADELWAKVIHLDDEYGCAICGGHRYLQAHHIVTRSLSASRHDPMNGIVLCAKHHTTDRYLSAHGAPVAFAEWLRIQRPSQYYYALEQKRKMLGAESNKSLYTKAIANLEKILDRAE